MREPPRPSQKVYRQRSDPLHASAPSRRRPPHRGANASGTESSSAGAPRVEFPPQTASVFVRCRPLAVVYFLRKRSSRTTSPPPSGLSESASDFVSAGSGLAATGTGTLVCVVALCSAGGRAPPRPPRARWSPCPASWHFSLVSSSAIAL